MIQEVLTPRCPHGQSVDIVKNGHKAKGQQQYRCKSCGKSGVLNPSVAYTEEAKARVLAAYYERPSMRGIERIFGVARQTLAAWLKKSGPRASRQRHAGARASARCTGGGRSVELCRQAAT
jgi:transposase-like protein